MQLNITSKQINLGDSLKSYIDEAVNRTVNKYFENPIQANINFTKEGEFVTVDISVHPAAGIKVQGRDSNPDPYTAFDEAINKIGKQLAKYKDRLTDYSKAAELMHLSVIKPEAEEEIASTAEPTPIIIAETEEEIPTCSVSGAVMRMDLASISALMFRNVKTNRLNVVYKRSDGNIGWLDPKEDK